MRDPQLALLLCRLLFGSAGSAAELRLVSRLHNGLQQSQHGDAPAMAAVCCLLQGDAAGALQALLGGSDAPLPLGHTAATEEDAQLLPVLAALLQASPALSAEPWAEQLAACLPALGRRLQGRGLHALAIEPVAAAAALRPPPSATRGSSGPAAARRRQQDELLLQRLVALSLLPGVLAAPASVWQAWAAAQVQQLVERGLLVEPAAVLSLLRDMRSKTSNAVSARASVAGQESRNGTEHHASIDRQGSSSCGSSSGSGTRRQPDAGGNAVIGEGYAAATPSPSPCCAAMGRGVLRRL
jgi:hypothetical protein